ncbi:C25 family cysteine peptidase [Bacteroidales bacterium OttesenSCG-928-K03]|nr:C25 family cysteine peptidase [Odoribacter sp. OttesenSCG-928-L07]MDL2239529.1 C25 family cysteine peptidase [Bacteroidales bacterium OttesenSCG-928-L14]MDL2242208.1 C25 family cysteine peptidase [Bacteroidales bacterium OttesenSCG-928-K03]
MKKLLFSFTLVLISVFTYGQVKSIAMQSNEVKQECIKDNFEGFNAVFSFDHINAVPINTEKGDFSIINIDGAFPTGNAGTPELPAFRKLIAIPQGATPKVIVKSYTEEEYDLNNYSWNKIFPKQPSTRKDLEPEDIIFVYEEAAYATKGYESREVAVVEELGTMRNIRIGSLQVNPIVYDAGSNKIKVRNNIEVEVVFEGADKTATQNLFESTYSIYFEPVYKQFFNRNIYDEHPDLYKTPVHMLVVANRMFEETLQPWIEWKTKKGFYMDVNYTDEVGTTANELKTLCQTKYNDGVANGQTPSFVVLVGDVAQVVASARGSKTYKDTDLYYGSVDGDYFPDMYYSRMSAINTTQLENIIEKILYYEQYQFEDPAYLDNVLLVAGADGNWNPKVGQPQMNYATTYYYNEDHGFENVHKYLTSPYTGCYNNLANVGFANYTAHCGETSWGDPSFTISGVNALTNVNKYFVAMGNCCLAADFGYGECIGEAFIRGNKKGAVGYIGSSPSSYWGEDFHFTVGAYAGSISTVATPTIENTSDGCYDLSFREADFHCLSSMIFGGNLSVTHASATGCTMHIGVEYYWQAYNVLGDGSLMPYWSQGDENTVSHMEIVPIGVDFYEVSAIPGSYVAISKDGVLHGAASVGETGTVQVPLIPITSGGDVDIVVTAPQRIPYITTRPAAALEGAYIVADAYQLAGDGILSYGETTEMELTIKNVGGDPSESTINVVLTNTDGLATVIEGTAQYPILEVGATATQSGFSFEVSQDVNNGQTIYFAAEITCGREVWTSNIAIKVYKPILSYETMVWKNSFSQGESFDIMVEYKNKGGYLVSNVEATLETTNADVTINVAETNLGTIAPDGIGYAIFNVTLSDDISESSSIDFVSHVSGDDGVITAEANFSLTNKCTMTFKMWDSSGDGWDNNGRISIKQNNVEIATVRLETGNYGTTTKDLPTGELDFVWIYGNSYDYENSFEIYNYNNELIYKTSGTPQAGSFLIYENTCSSGSGNTFEAPKELVVEIVESTVTISWVEPEEREWTNFSILKDGLLLDVITETIYVENEVEEGAHTYCVIANYDDGSSVPVCENVVVSPVGISTFDNNIIVYPNPATNNVTVKGNDILVIKVYNTHGQLILVEKDTEVINVSSFNNGIYIFSIETKDGSRVQRKIIVSH